MKKFLLYTFLLLNQSVLIGCYNHTTEMQDVHKDGFLFDRSTNLRWPVQGSISSEYGWRGRRKHQGIDIRANYGEPIYAAQRGEVVFAGWLSGYGRTVILSHPPYTTLYAHCSKLKVHAQQKVNKGDVIGRIGTSGKATGPHLHFELRNSKNVSLNPIAFLPKKDHQLLAIEK